MGVYTLTTEEVRDIIEGRTKFKKCPVCDSKGEVSFEEDGETYYEECENCKGLGYLSKESFEE